MSQIESPVVTSDVAPVAERKGSGVGRRFLATLVDGIVLGVLAAVWFSMFGEDGACDSALNLSYTAGSDTTSVCGAPAGVFFLVVIAYYVVLEKLLGGTLGKLVLGMRVQQLDGSPISWGQAAIRTILRPIDGFLFYIVAAIAVWASPRNQRLGDMAAKTLVAPR